MTELQELFEQARVRLLREDRAWLLDRPIGDWWFPALRPLKPGLLRLTVKRLVFSSYLQLWDLPYAKPWNIPTLIKLLVHASNTHWS